MKKVILIAAVSMLALASCKKEYTCECSQTDSSGSFEDQTSSFTFTAKKSDAEASCGNLEVTSGTFTTKCSLK